MTTAFISHPDCFKHDMGRGHPEQPARLQAIEDRLIASGLAALVQRHEAPLAQIELTSHAPEVVLVRVADIVSENDPAFAATPSSRMTAITSVASQNSLSIQTSPFNMLIPPIFSTGRMGASR